MEEDFTASFSQIQAGALRASDLVSHVVSFDRVPTYLDFLERGVENARAETVRGVVVDFRLNDADLAIEDYQRLLHFVGDTWRPRPALSAAYPDETRRAFVLKERVAEQLRVNCARATLDPEQERKLNVAFQIAFAAHRNPLPGSEVHRSDGLSFVLHCTRVALYLVRTVRTADAELIAAAFVHDVLEHTTLGLSELRESLGEGSDAIVDIAEDLSQSSYLTRGPLPETLVRQVAERLGDPSVRSLLVERSDDENPDSLRRLLVKVEHFQRLLQRAKDPRSPLLKVVDNLISYDTSAYSPRAVPRTRTELALFRYFVENGPVVRDHPAVAREALLVVEQLAAPNLLAQEWSAVVPQLKLLLAMKFEPTVG
jgi:hypothetical protein